MDGTANGPKSVCSSPRCATVFDGLDRTCPTCGKRAVPQRRIRVLGILMVFCGLLLLGIMLPIAYYTVPMMMHPGQEIRGSTFTGTAEDVEFALSLYTAVIIFGLGALIAGTMQAVRGRQSLLINMALIVLGIGMFWYGKMYMKSHGG